MPANRRLRQRHSRAYMLAIDVLVNGVTEEVIHRGFLFGHVRRGRSFATAATVSATLFAAQHLYIIGTTGWTIGLASVLLAALLAYPMAFVFDRGGNAIAGPAILHTSSNAPVMISALPEDFVTLALLPHMGRSSCRCTCCSSSSTSLSRSARPRRRRVCRGALPRKSIVKRARRRRRS